MADLSALLMTSDLMDRIAAVHGDDVEIRTVLLAVEVDGGDIYVEGDARPWVNLAFIEEVVAEIESEQDRTLAPDEEDDDDA